MAYEHEQSHVVQSLHIFMKYEKNKIKTNGKLSAYTDDK